MRDILDRVGIDINDSENGFFATNRSHNGTHSDAFYQDLYEALSEAKGSYEKVFDVLETVRQVVGNGGEWM
jgi:hypothetical protein